MKYSIDKEYFTYTDICMYVSGNEIYSNENLKMYMTNLNVYNIYNRLQNKI